MNGFYDTVVQALEESVKRNLTRGLLLSGGLDTSILAYLAAKWVKQDCVTVALRDAPAPDIEYAKLVASRLKLRHYIHYLGGEELDESIQAVVRIMKTFDPMEVRNSAAIFAGLKAGRELGLTSFMTGDGGDELFAGYSFFFGLSIEQLDIALGKLWAAMSFSSVNLGRELGLEVKLPFLDPQFKAFAMNINAGLKVGSERGRVWGKLVLRRAFENIVPPEIVWRAKAPIEEGSGTAVLPLLFNARISDSEFDGKKAKYLKEDRVNIRSKEHLYYYEIYRRVVGVPQTSYNSLRTCPDCRAALGEGVSFCRTCGAYPV